MVSKLIRPIRQELPPQKLNYAASVQQMIRSDC